jgi:hypothetical protein
MESERSHLLQLRQAVAADLVNLKTKEDRWVTKQQQPMGEGLQQGFVLLMSVTV